MAFSGSTFSLLKDWLRVPWRNNQLFQAQLDAEFSGIATGLTSAKTGVVSYTVATLPAGAAGNLAYASDGRKTGEGGGAGTGTLVYKDATAWRRVSDDSTVAA